MNTIVALLIMILNNNFTKDTNYHIALCILKKLMSPDELTIANIAKDAYTSNAAVTKFYKMLGQRNFMEFKHNLLRHINVRKEQIHHRVTLTNENEILNNIVHFAQVEFDVEKFKTSVETLVDLIHKKDEMYIIGAHFPTALAINIQEDLAVFGKVVITLPQIWDIDIDPQIQDAVVLLISLTGRMYEYAKDSFEEYFSYSLNHNVMMSGYQSFPMRDKMKAFIHIPVGDDHEVGNILILEIFRYIKYIYVTKYGEEL